MTKKMIRSSQAPASVVMVRPHYFSVNTETASDNAFQKKTPIDSAHAKNAYDEITAAVEVLRKWGVRVHLFEGEDERTPDCVFPNNWFSTHMGGHVALYPMKVPSRRLERRYDVIEKLKQNYRVQEVIDYSGLEPDGLFLEGTGAMVLDHKERVAYVAESDRADPIALERFCTQFGYEPMAFKANDPNGVPIYHTNVLMGIGTEYALIGLDTIADLARRREIETRLESPGRTIIPLTFEQLEGFAGNAIELQGHDTRILALSQTAFDVLEVEQKKVIEESAVLVPLNIPTVELSGGSVRCTIAGVHLSPRDE